MYSGNKLTVEENKTNEYLASAPTDLVISPRVCLCIQLTIVSNIAIIVALAISSLHNSGGLVSFAF